jgi:MFS family permease
VGTFILFTGRVGDLFGWKRLFVIGFAWFALWTLVCGVAYYSNHVLFVFARVLQGIGPAIVLPNGLALLGALYQSGPRKNMAFAVFGACAPTGYVTGAVFAGIFNLAWWPCKSVGMRSLLSLTALRGILLLRNNPHCYRHCLRRHHS